MTTVTRKATTADLLAAVTAGRRERAGEYLTMFRAMFGENNRACVVPMNEAKVSALIDRLCDTGALMVVELDGETAGMIAVQMVEAYYSADPVCAVLWTYVPLRWRGEGIGRALMQCAEEWSRANGAAAIMTGATVDAEVGAMDRMLLGLSWARAEHRWVRKWA